MSGVLIDYETADRITLSSLKDHLEFLENQLIQHEEGRWLHPDDIANSKELIPAFQKVIHYFGG